MPAPPEGAVIPGARAPTKQTFMLEPGGVQRYSPDMNKLPSDRRAQIIGLMAEGVSIRAICRLTGVSKNTVAKLLRDAGEAFSACMDRELRGLRCKRLQLDEVWSFVYAKQKNVPAAKAAPEGAGDIWTWVALDADTKLVASYYVGNRDAAAAELFVSDLAGRLAGRAQVTSDGLKLYVEAVEKAFGSEVDYAMLVKLYGEAPEGPKRYSPAECVGCKRQAVSGSPDPAHVSTSFAERQNLNIRMGNRRMTRLTNAFSKKAESHAHGMAVYFMHYNFVRIHQTTRLTPAMAAGVADRLWELSDLVAVLESWETDQGAGGSEDGQVRRGRD
jgi:IS1 family transposase